MVGHSCGAAMRVGAECTLPARAGLGSGRVVPQQQLVV